MKKAIYRSLSARAKQAKVRTPVFEEVLNSLFVNLKAI